MKPSYEDITSRIAAKPKWYDPNGVPRYSIFNPNDCSIYACEGCLYEIECQNCRRKFAVAEVMELHDERDIATRIREKTLGYGDPPNMGCCCAGPTMSSDSKRVLEYWILDRTNHVWKRDASLEVDLETGADWEW